jgi:hypothetical protein
VPRSFVISAPAPKIDAILQRVHGRRIVVSMSRSRGASLVPPGDVLSIQTTNDGARELVGVLDEVNVLEDGSFHSTKLQGLFSASARRDIETESNETFWDEMGFLLREDTNVSVNYLGLMALAGALAATGFALDALPVILAAITIAPAFEPLLRIGFGLVGGPRAMWQQGLLAAASGYLLLMAGAAAATLVLQQVGSHLTSGLEGHTWVAFWSGFTVPGLLPTLFAAVAGALIICGLRSVLTTGVMMALGLVPSLALGSAALVLGEFALASRAFARWMADASIVLVLSAVVLAAKAALVHRTRSVD